MLKTNRHITQQCHKEIQKERYKERKAENNSKCDRGERVLERLQGRYCFIGLYVQLMNIKLPTVADFIGLNLHLNMLV